MFQKVITAKFGLIVRAGKIAETSPHRQKTDAQSTLGQHLLNHGTVLTSGRSRSGGKPLMMQT